ncbi:MAG: zinc ribbon domain-containing protein [Ruminococcaceae bacterium]|nr:zinc ribbon domain-containing protein [Oscillospiraceae bacterium]
MNCPNCGNPMGAEDVFCGICGARITPPATTPVDSIPPQPAPSGMPEVITPTGPVPPVMPEIEILAAPVKKKSKKKKIIIITAIVTVLAIIAGILSWVFIFSKESVWLITSEIAYEADGSRGSYQRKYTYTEKGLPLEITYDWGGQDKYWDDVNGYYIYYNLPYDGTIDTSVEFGYNEEGDILYYAQKGENYNYSEEGAFSYNYDKNGRIESIDCYGAKIPSGYDDKVLSVMHYCYDDNGNLIEIYTENLKPNTTKWDFDFRYDSKNRLIGHTLRWSEACWYYQYEYNDKDQLTCVTRSYATSQARLDDQHVSESYAAVDVEFTVQNEWDFEYDSKGNLISRGDITCTYDNGKLSTVTYDSDTTYRYTDSDTGADDSDIVLVRDKNGNVVKKIYTDGSYVEYTYKEFRLSKEDAQYCRNAQMAWHRTGPTGYGYQFFAFGGSYGFLKYLPIPTTDLMQFDILTQKD